MCNLRQYISLSFDKTIATALVSSRFDCCNSLLYNTANNYIAKLQHVNHFSARALSERNKENIICSPCFSHSVPLWIHGIGTLCIITLFFKICTIAIKPSYQQNQHIRCSLQREIPDSYDQPVVTLFTFLIRLELEGNIVSFHKHIWKLISIKLPNLLKFL